MKSKKIWWFSGALILLLSYFIWDAYSQPNIKDLPGGFEEVAFVRNEQNKGGIVRIYAVTVADLVNAKFDECADLFPVNDYGSVTKIYFFDKNSDYPTSLHINEPHFDQTKYQPIQILRRHGTN